LALVRGIIYGSSVESESGDERVDFLSDDTKNIAHENFIATLDWHLNNTEEKIVEKINVHGYVHIADRGGGLIRRRLFPRQQEL
jgi:hypothetical protein